MSDEPLANAAVEWMQQGYDYVNTAEGPMQPRADVMRLLAADCTLEDRRTGGFNIGTLHLCDMEA